MERPLAGGQEGFRAILQDRPKIAEFDPLCGRVPGMIAHHLEYATNNA